MPRIAKWTLVGALVATTAAAQPRDFSRVEVKAAHVAGNVHVVTGMGGNIGVLAGPDGILLVDDQFAPLAPKIEKAIAPLSKRPVRFVLNTHWHGDHTHGNEVFGKTATVLAHENVRVRMADPEQAKARGVSPAPPHALPVITYKDGLSVHLNGEEIRVFHVGPAHTDGDSVVVFPKSNVIHMGDLFFNGTFPFVDLDSGGSVKGLIAALKKVRAHLTPQMKIIPGHGAVATIKEFDAYLAMLENARARVEKGVAQGKSAEQLKKENVLGAYEKWSFPFATTEKFIDTLHRDVAGKGTK